MAIQVEDCVNQVNAEPGGLLYRWFKVGSSAGATRSNPSTQWTNAPTHARAHRGGTSKWRVKPRLPEPLDRHDWRTGGAVQRRPAQ